MRRLVAIAGVVGLSAGLLGLTACSSSGSGTDTSNSTAVTTPDTGIPGTDGNPITGPIDRARSVVGQQNSQLSQEEQRTGSEDPTVP